MNDPPKDPFGTFADGAAATHEMFISYVLAGFTRPEALQIVIALLTNTQNNMPSQEEGDANERT